ncbi:TetR/AcrR family transcriptional regulator [Skermania piniformis]|uniref:TetR/AcrR family transcriptional regulator n=1 Tax=Skermania pinensis TaxID=39122 RepID=A0ABX8SDV8_9ACTN|nr:TetR/AcrR family transcriptional regulator [Skermania piniformis]QXQ15501.1 TetR/AcrR family transcriptional regulator [Skermania piniformis]
MTDEPGPSRQGRKRAATRESIIDAAEALLERGGVDAVTLPAVSERADVALQTIYNRVGGRDAVLLAVAERALAANRDYMDEMYARPGTPEERIVAAGAAYAQFAAERPHQFRLLAAPPDLPEALDRIADLTDEQNGKLAAVLRDGVAAGTMRADLDVDQTATVLWAAFNGVLALSWRADRHRAAPDQLLALLAAIVADGIRVR